MFGAAQRLDVTIAAVPLDNPRKCRPRQKIHQLGEQSLARAHRHGGGGGWHHHGGGGIGTGAAVALGLGAFFLGSALASAPYYNNYYSNSYPYNDSYGYGFPYTYGPPATGIIAIRPTVTPPDKRIASHHQRPLYSRAAGRGK